jgi:acyl-CoA thioesterase
MEVGDRHLNGLGVVQGGAIFTLADIALAAASNAHGTAAVSINANISYFKAVTGGTLVAEATEESLNHKLATYSVRVTAGDGGELIALFQGTVYRKKETIKSLL